MTMTMVRASLYAPFKLLHRRARCSILPHGWSWRFHSTDMNTSPSVLISGAGPSGLVLALALRQNGVNVRIIDKEAGPRLGERGPGVSPRSLEVHKILGTFDDVIKAAGSLPTSKDYDPVDPYKVLKTYNLMLSLKPTPAIPFCNPVILGQNHHERILREHLEHAGTSVEFGSELRSFEQTDDNKVRVQIARRNVDGEEIVDSSDVSWLIGADGARSLVRKTLGLSFLGETREDHEMVIGDVRIKSEPREFWERWGDPKNKIFISRPSFQDSDIISFLIAGNIDSTKLLSTPSAVIDEFYEITGRKDIILGDVIWVSKYRPNIRMVDRLGVGRVFLVGDAAHCHSPTGGQGLNSSIQDSLNLAWKLALVHTGTADQRLLRTYDEERLPVIAQMLNKTTELLKHTINDLDGAESKAEQKEIRKDMNQLGVNYRGSSIVLYGEGIAGSDAPRGIGYSKESETAALPGDRAPEAPGLVRRTSGPSTAVSLFDLLRPSRHLALVFSDGRDDATVMKSIAEALETQPASLVHSVLLLTRQGLERPDVAPTDVGVFDEVLYDEEGHAFKGYHIDADQGVKTGPVVVIVRPDGIIGARVRDAQGVATYFSTIFGAAT